MFTQSEKLDKLRQREQLLTAQYRARGATERSVLAARLVSVRRAIEVLQLKRQREGAGE